MPWAWACATVQAAGSASVTLKSNCFVCVCSWQSGVIKVMCGLLAEGDNIVEEQTAGVCASIVRDPEGRNIMFEEGAITALAELVEAGETARTKEYAVNALLGLAVHSKACLAAIDDEGITASIDVMTRTGSTKTQAKVTSNPKSQTLHSCNHARGCATSHPAWPSPRPLEFEARTAVKAALSVAR